MDEFLFTIKELQVNMFKSDCLNQFFHSLEIQAIMHRLHFNRTTNSTLVEKLHLANTQYHLLAIQQESRRESQMTIALII